MLLKFDPVQLFYPIRNLCQLTCTSLITPSVGQTFSTGEPRSSRQRFHQTKQTPCWQQKGLGSSRDVLQVFHRHAVSRALLPPPILPLRPHQRYCSSHRHSLWLQRCSWLSSDRLSRAEGFPTFLWSLNVDAHFNDWRAQRTSRVRMEITWRHTDSSDRSL